MMPPGMPSGMGPPVMPGLGSAMQGVPVGDPVQRAPPPHATMAPTAGFVPGEQPQAFYPPLPDVAPADPKTVPAGPAAASAASVPPAPEPAPAPAAEAAAAAPPATSEPAGAS